MNPGRLVLLIGGVVAILVGIRGSQSATFNALTGKGSTATTSTSSGSPAIVSAVAHGTPTSSAPGSPRIPLVPGSATVA